MFRPLLDPVRREVSGERALETVRALARHHRLQASPGYDAAADWLAGKIEANGLRVEITRVPADGRTRTLGHLMPRGWACRRAGAVLHDGGASRRVCDYDAEKLSLIQRSSAVRGRFPLAPLEDGTEPAHYQGLDVRGRVVLTSSTDVHRVHELAVVERGAAGLLACGRRLLPPVRDAFTDPDSIAYTSFWWGPDEPQGWGFVVSPREGARLRERLRGGAALDLEVEVEARAFDTTIPLVSALLEPDAAASHESEVVVVSHLCHPQPGANDNASGVGANLEAARVLRVLRARGELPATRRIVRHLWVPELTGTIAWLASRPGDAPSIVAALNLDMVGEDQAQCGSTFLLEHPPCFAASFAETLLGAIRERAMDVTHAYSEVGRIPVLRVGEVPFAGGSDHAVLGDPAVGAPCPMLIQWPDRYYHSSYDTPDRCDPRALALSARCAAIYAGWLAAAGGDACEALAALVARRARARLLEALEHEEPARAVEAERLRSLEALRSIARLVAPDARGEVEARVTAPATRGLEDFADREIVPHILSHGEISPDPGDEARTAVAAGARPRRRLGVPLHYQRRLIDGFPRLPAEAREAWRRAEQPPEDLAQVFDLAWMACDGTRSLDEITRLVWLESGRRRGETIRRFFDWAARLGVSEWAPPPEDS